MTIKQKIFFIIITSIYLFGQNLPRSASYVSDDKISIVYISDLNLYNTPSQNQLEKHMLEKRFGVLVYESQAIFQEIIKYINQKLDPEIVIFGGNNISDLRKDENLWTLFLDMVSEIKGDIFMNLGTNEIKAYNTDELLQSLKTFDSQRNTLWHLRKIKNYLFIGLDSVSLFDNPKLSKEQLQWFLSTLSQNQNVVTVVSLHYPLLGSEGEIINNSVVKRITEIISVNPQIKLVLSGGGYFNRVHLLNGCVFVNAPSPVVYPCSFKVIELLPGRIKIKTVNILLKGIIKKALKSAQDAEVFKAKLPLNQIKSYLLGKNQDLQFNYSFSDLKNR